MPKDYSRVGLGIAFTALTTLVHAQTVAPAQVGDSAEGALEEIVVTAQKREERQVNVPMTLTVLSAQQLQNAGVVNMTDLPLVVPGLRMDSSGAYLQPTIRGVGSAVAGPGFTPNIPIYIDGFYQPAGLANTFNFIDVDSVQVLEGPQGTLFGRNATGGAILVTSKGPSFDPHLDASVGYGSYNEVTGKLYATGGITDTLAGSISLFADHSDGWITNVLTDTLANANSNYDVKGKLLFEPSTRANLTLTLEYSTQKDPTMDLTNDYNGWATAALFPGAIVETTRDRVSNAAPVNHENDEYSAYLKGQFDLGFANLTSLTMGQRTQDYEALDLSTTNIPLAAVNWHVNEYTYSQEFDLGSSNKGPIDWVTGIFFYHDFTFYPELNLSAGGGPFGFDYSAGQSAQSVALFGDATYNISKLHFTLGVRGSNDHGSESYQTANTAQVNPPGKTWNSLTPRAVVRYEVTDNSNVYVSYSEGTKAGVFNPAGQQPTPVDPERIKDFEGGYKIATRDWQFEGAAFHYDYTNLQVASYEGPTELIQNAGKAEIYGATLHWSQRLTDRLKLDFGNAYTHGRYTYFPAAATYVWSPTSGVGQMPADVTGNAMERSPAYSGNVSLDYTQPLLGGKMELNGIYSYQSKVYFDLDENANQPGYGILNLRAAWTNQSGRWTFSLYGRNVTNKVYLVQINENTLNFGQIFGQPATVFVEAKFHY